MMCELFATFTTEIDYRNVAKTAKRGKVFNDECTREACREHLTVIRSHESKKGERVTFRRDVEISWNRCGRRIA